ncbi:hypothetical protein I4U23_009812 [Adineta vaga]|nr:hypothetical protein I4U23_009812 [Adineta vaga]
MTSVLRSKENDSDFVLYKTPKHTNLLSSTTMNDRVFHSNNLKRLTLTGITSTNDFSMYNNNNTMMTPIRLNKRKFSTPGSLQRRCALGLMNSNSKQICQIFSSDDLSSTSSSNLKESNHKHDELVILQAPSPAMSYSYSEDDLPHQSTHHNEDTFADLIPKNERIEQMIHHQSNGINIFTFHGGIENTIRYQSPQCSRINISTLLDMFN